MVLEEERKREEGAAKEKVRAREREKKVTFVRICVDHNKTTNVSEVAIDVQCRKTNNKVV